MAQEHLKINDYNKKNNINKLVVSKYIYKILKYSLNKGNKELEEEFSNPEDLELFFHYLIWHYYFTKYYITIKKNVDCFIEFIDHLINKKEKIFADKK